MANLDFFGVFDFQEGDDSTYEYTSTEFVKIYRAMTANGVVKSHLNEMAVTVDGLDVSVNTGAAFLNGRYGEITTAKALAVTSTGSVHIDRVILKLDVSARTITVEVKQGAATPPTLTQNETVYEMSLAQITVPASGVSAVLADERTFFYQPSQVMDKMNNITSGSEYVYAVYA